MGLTTESILQTATAIEPTIQSSSQLTAAVERKSSAAAAPLLLYSVCVDDNKRSTPSTPVERDYPSPEEVEKRCDPAAAGWMAGWVHKEVLTLCQCCN